jgi:large subunit ribosomal protein L21
MYAIVEIAGKQFKVAPDQYIYAPLLAGEAGSPVELGNVLLMGEGNDLEVGAPSVSGARVAATIVEHVKGDKVIIFKKKRRKGYRKKQGHRQQYTKLLIDEILGDGQQASPKKKEEPKPEPVEATSQESTASADAMPQETAASEPAHVLPASDELTPAPVDESATDNVPAADTASDSTSEQDDLKNISGIGPVFEQELNRLGIYTYQQLADLSSEEIDRIDEEIVGADRGMIEDEWIPQAKELMNK